MLVRRNGPTRINSCRALPENLLEKQARIQANPVHLFNPLIQPAYSTRLFSPLTRLIWHPPQRRFGLDSRQFR